MGVTRSYHNREEYVLLNLLRLPTLEDSSTGEGLRGAIAFAGLLLLRRSKESTRTIDPARLILVDSADDELEEGGVGD